MQQIIKNLLEENRILEEKIFSNPKQVGLEKALITQQELLEALERVSGKVIQNKHKAFSISALLNDCDEIKGRPFSTLHRNSLQLVEILFNYLRENSSFEAKYFHIINNLQLAFIHLSLNDLGFIESSQHEAIIFLEKLISLEHHFSNKPDPLSQSFINAVQHLVEVLAKTNNISKQTFIKAERKLREYCIGFDNKVNTNINNVLIEIKKESKKSKAEFDSKELMKRQTQGDEMPIFLLDFYESHVSKLLYLLVLKYGHESDECQQLLSDIDIITWSVTCPPSDEKYKSTFDTDISQAMKRIYILFDSNQLINEYVNDFFMEVEELHSKKLQGQAVKYDVVISAGIFMEDDEDLTTSWQDGSSTSSVEDFLEEGQWYNLTKNDEIIYSQLLMKNPYTKQLIFVNISGEVSQQVNSSDTDYLKNNVSVPTPNEYIKFEHTLKVIEQELSSRLNILKTEYDSVKVKQAIDAEQKTLLEAESRKKIKQRLEEDKKQQLFNRELEIKKDIEAQAEKRHIELLKSKQEETFKNLVPDAVIAHKKEDGRWYEATLTLISKSTQKFIFSDNKGNNVLEIKKDDVFRMVADQQLKLIKQVDLSFDPLQALVQQRRQVLAKK